ncbi:hypothetical protein FKM82_028340 [Ascaphus truei]
MLYHTYLCAPVSFFSILFPSAWSGSLLPRRAATGSTAIPESLLSHNGFFVPCSECVYGCSPTYQYVVRKHSAVQRIIDHIY